MVLVHAGLLLMLHDGMMSLQQDGLLLLDDDLLHHGPHFSNMWPPLMPK